MKKNNHFANSRIADVLDKTIPGSYKADDSLQTWLAPVRIVWMTDGPQARVENAAVLLREREPQISLENREPCLLKNSGGHAGVLLDFGTEIYGGIQLAVWGEERPGETSHMRLRFGESAMEAMSEPGENHSGNYHSMRDYAVEVPHLGTYESSRTGFRFVRIDWLDDGELAVKFIRAFAVLKDVPYLGSFRCSDKLLNRIWQVGAYTVHLNMQNHYIWDGIKRDRLVWIGDIFTEIQTIEAVFGPDDSIARSLDFVRDMTPLPGWMNQIPTYSMWWILSQYHYYRYHGDTGYLARQSVYLRALTRQLIDCIASDGHSDIPPMRFVDWETLDDTAATDAGVQALHIMALESAMRIFRALEDGESAALCEKAVARLGAYCPPLPAQKQEAALMALAGIADPAAADQAVLSPGGAQGFSTFMGYFILKARALAGEYQECLDCIRTFWGGMLELGATTFWESFDLSWKKQAAPIDTIASGGKIDVHGSYGDHCYKGYRKSLCHGWASGPTAWLSEYVLGIRIEEPGCRTVRIEPHLGDLTYAEGRYPTPYGIIRVHHRKREDGSVQTTVSAPPEVHILKN